ncbi:MAG: hypothetical protein KGI71_05360 [Patescibacteria group bacterium]|nr:hypothetical protein [Patescibacteria group bacterium]
MSFSKGGSYQHQGGSQSLNAPTTQYLQGIWNAARQAGQQGPSPLVTGAAGYNTNLQNAGNLGMQALSGNPSQMNLLMSPYISNVIGSMNDQLAHTNAMGTNAINSQATQAGAFGGGRQGVAEGVMLSNNALNTNSQIANLLNQGYQNAQGVAQNLAGMGYMGAGQNANLGMQGVGNNAQWLMNMLRQGYLGPTGTSYSGSSWGTNAQAGFP